ncbi:MAG TPA: 1-acyl-sn-glycerol-3-phosphate acyltransferase [Acidimicrobiia bacterium]|nr:1-acyl-sn-glycerol-3-phosphate acyltransferase [Acidimicrobiia bacterium]
MSPQGNRTDELLAGPPGASVLYLVDAASDYEAVLLERWVRRENAGHVGIVRIASSRRGVGGDEESLGRHLLSGDNLYLIPVRLVWMPPKKQDGRRPVRWTDVFQPGDPRDPRGLRARWIRTFRRDRVRLIAAGGAFASEMAADYEVSGQVDPLASYVTRRAWSVLDRAERKLRGNRYKIPRFVPEAVLSRKEFLDAIDQISRETNTEIEVGRAKAERYLREMAATHSPYAIDLIANGIHKLYSQGYGGIRYDHDQVRKVAELGQEHPVIFLPSHRSNLDRLSLQFMLWENDLPPNHTAGGINMNFFPVGPLMRRTGVFFIRRSFKDNRLYKAVLKGYLDYLIEKRFPLEWYLEGGRSRSGRLGAPHFGLLSYVVDSLRRGKTDDIQLIPVSIAYDQIQDVPDYAREAMGKGKQKETLGWLFRAVKSLRRRYGNIYIRFGESISVAAALASIDEGDESSIGLQKLGFEVMYRIGKVTPITPAALVTVALLGARGSARNAEQVAEECVSLSEFVTARALPTTEDLDLADAARVTAVLDWLGEHGNVSSHSAVGRRVFWLDEEQMVRIAYYRNVIVHFFVPRALAEMALTGLVDRDDVTGSEVDDALLRLRDLLKFEFFFQEKQDFLDSISADVELDVPDWRASLTSNGAAWILSKMGAQVARWAVMPFLDAYQIVGDELEATRGSFNEKSFLKACLERARMYRIEGRLISGESASQVMFKSALSLADNRGLLTRSGDVDERRRQFAREIREARDLAATGL